MYGLLGFGGGVASAVYDRINGMTYRIDLLISVFTYTDHSTAIDSIGGSSDSKKSFIGSSRESTQTWSRHTRTKITRRARPEILVGK